MLVIGGKIVSFCTPKHIVENFGGLLAVSFFFFPQPCDLNLFYMFSFVNILNQSTAGWEIVMHSILRQTIENTKWSSKRGQVYDCPGVESDMFLAYQTISFMIITG